MNVEVENQSLATSNSEPRTGEFILEKAPCYHLVGEDE